MLAKQFPASRPEPALRLVQASRPERPQPQLHPEAMRVLDILAEDPPPRGGIATLRQHHARSRRRFLAPLEPVSRKFQLLPGGGVPPLTVFRPSTAPPGVALPALIFLHGGGWTLGALETYEPFCRQLANATESVVIWVEYRLAPEHPFPAAFDDVRATLRWVHANTDRLGIVPERIALCGDSAGGNLAAAVSQEEYYERTPFRPWRQILLYPCLDMMACMASHRAFADGYLLTARIYEWYRGNYVGETRKPGHWRLSPLFAHDVSGLPPTVLLYAGFDPLRDEAAAYAMKLAIAGVRLETLYFPDMIHGFLTMGGAISAANTAVTRIAGALEKLNDAGKTP